MLKLYINDTDQSAYLSDNSLSITDQIQNKANTAAFELNPGATMPSENQFLEIYDCVDIVSLSSVTLEVKDKLRSGLSILTFGKFRAGEYLWLGVGAATQERVTIDSVVASSTSGQVTITLTAAAVSSHSAGELAGKKIFGGSLSNVAKQNPRLLSDVEYACSATDYTKIFDKKNINDTWQDADARYIFNDALNTTINYNHELDDLDYDDNAAIQLEWIESGDGGNPTVDTSDYLQGTSCGLFSWTNAGGTATFSATPSSFSASDFTGIASGIPTKGNVSFWYKRTAATGITSLAVRVGSDNLNYARVSFTPALDTDWHFVSLPLTAASITGTPVWTATDYLALVVTETASGSIRIDDLRLTADGSFTMYNFEATSEFTDVHAAFKKPTLLIDALAKTLSSYWYIDYDRDIHFFDRESNAAPFGINDTSDNFGDLKVDVDTTQLKNRQVVRGGVKTSESEYSEVKQGDNVTREWILKSQFKNLEVWLDNNSSTDTMEATTTTTTVKATAHGLVSGDWIVNRTRSAARQISVVDADHFTVSEVLSQASGDTFSKFSIQKVVGVENLVDETTVDYLSNYNEKSIRASSVTESLVTTEYLLFIYNEIVPIRVQVSDPTSIAAMKALGMGDGVFDGAVITDQSLDSTQAAQDRARAEVNQYSNPLMEVNFKTDFEGLSSGQLLEVIDTNKNVDNTFLIQQVRTRYNGDFPTFTVKCASTLFGIIEYFQKLSQAVSDRLIDEDEIIDQIIGDLATVTITDVNRFTATETAEESATISIVASETAADRNVTTSPYLWEPDPSDSRWNLAQWG